MNPLRRGFLRLAAAAATLPVVSRSARAQANPKAPVTASLAGERLTLDNLYERVHEGFADHDGVKIHYVTIGEGPLVFFIHGFPDQWFTWRHQMVALAENYNVVAMSQRGYNKSDKPKGVANYDIKLLAGDVATVLRHLGREHAVIVGHDWGGSVAWHFAELYPGMVDGLVIFNSPHPRPRWRELAFNKQQQERSAYIARITTTDGDLGGMNIEQLAERRAGGTSWYERYIEAYRQSNYESMLNYYRARYGPPPCQVDQSPPVKIQAPVLMFYGLDDVFYVHETLNDTWEWLSKDLTLVTLPGVGHNSPYNGLVEYENRMLKAWLELKGFDK